MPGNATVSREQILAKADSLKSASTKKRKTIEPYSPWLTHLFISVYFLRLITLSLLSNNGFKMSH